MINLIITMLSISKIKLILTPVIMINDIKFWGIILKLGKIDRWIYCDF